MGSRRRRTNASSSFAPSYSATPRGDELVRPCDLSGTGKVHTERVSGREHGSSACQCSERRMCTLLVYSLGWLACTSSSSRTRRAFLRSFCTTSVSIKPNRKLISGADRKQAPAADPNVAQSNCASEPHASRAARIKSATSYCSAHTNESMEMHHCHDFKVALQPHESSRTHTLVRSLAPSA